MSIKLYQVDAFTDQLFSGNPAAVCPLNKWLPDSLLQKFATENTLADITCFIRKSTKNEYELRWFTSELEIDLCARPAEKVNLPNALFFGFAKISAVLGVIATTPRDQVLLSGKNSESFKFYKQNQKSIRDLSKEAGSFLWLRLFKDVILKLPHDEQAKQEMIEKLKECYHNDNQQLKSIEKFNQEYDSDHAILYYTKELFLYTQLNRALRTEDIDLLYKFRYFIIDLSTNLFKENQLSKELNDSELKLFRGVKLSREEAQKLEDNVGKLISTNGYLSTSLVKEVASSFHDSLTEDETNILFEISCDLETINFVIMAPIFHLSQHHFEEEVLFDFDSTFEILSVCKNESLNQLVVKMKVTDEGSILAQEYIKQHQYQIATNSAMLIYGRLLNEIGQYDKSQHYFENLLNKSNESDQVFIHYHLGIIHCNKGHYEKALEYYQTSYDILTKTIAPSSSSSSSQKASIANVLNDIGTVYNIKGDYETSLDYYHRSLEIAQQHSIYSTIAICFGSIANVYRIQGKYDFALDYQMKCLKIKKHYLPTEHKEIARTLDHLAAIYNDKDDLNNAMLYHEESLKMNKHCLPIEHDLIGSNFHHIATIYTNQGRYNDALCYYNRSLHIKQRIFPNGHLSIVKILNKIGYIYYLQKDYDQALNYLNRSLQMREHFFSDINDISLLHNLTYIGLVLTKQQKLLEALASLTRAETLAKNLLPVGHEDMTDCLTNMAILYREMKDYSKASEYFDKASQNEEQNCIKPNLIRLARIYDNLGICLCYQDNDKTGIAYRMKAVRLIVQASPRVQHADWIDTVANVCFEKELYVYAFECYLLSLNMRLECLPNDHLDVAESLMFLGDVHVKIDIQNKALMYYEQALNIYEDKEHFNSIYVLNSMGTVYENMHQYHLALNYFTRTLYLQKNTFH
ncbi:hypothetical protein I4U23_012299 [Adineta vaga]|nr:hypothetical protein I4U23_012299 [Adineta vaga]